MKNAVVVMLFILGFSVVAAAQQSNDLDKLIAVQKTERDAMYSRQESESKLLIQIQQSTLEHLGGGEGTRAEVAAKHIEEREKVSIRQAAERAELARLHQQERVKFEECPKTGKSVG
jgi:hypothetical protein